MRKNQVTISVMRFGDQIPRNRQYDKMTDERVSAIELVTYTDSNDVFEALAAAYSNIIQQISSEQEVPSFGTNDGVKVKVKGYYRKGLKLEEFEDE